MTNSAPSKQTMAASNYKKQLEGINVSGILLDLWKDAYSKNVQASSGAEATAAPIATPHSETDAIEVLRKAGDPSKLNKKKSIVMPIRVLQSIRILVPSTTQESLDRALESGATGLAFTPPYEPEMTPERKKYLERMEKLRLKSEETKYTRITRNIKDQRQEDDKTAKSMTYAASVGINMIVAPISFGTFMYFFSGGIFDFFFPPNEDENPNRHPSGVDIKRVIVGVVSGVIMMIIEMVLFVIRSHEFDAHTTKKKKKRGVQPFGSYSANSAMSYTDGSSRKTPNAAPSGNDLATKKAN